MGHARSAIIMLLVAGMLSGLVAPPSYASELHPETVAAFDHYIHLVEVRMDDDLRNNRFLYIDSMATERRDKIYAQLRAGELYIDQLHTLENGEQIHVPSGLINHWIGIAFIPRDAFSQTLYVLQDYQQYAQIYRPDIQRSKLLERNGDLQKVYLQLYKKSLVTVYLNGNFNSDFRSLSATRAQFRSYSTQITEIQNHGGPDEHDLPVGKDHGYLWRLNSYWRVEQKDGGVYLQVESIALSRGVPLAIAWLVNPAIRSLARAVIANLLNQTVKAVTDGDSSSTRIQGAYRGRAGQPGRPVEFLAIACGDDLGHRRGQNPGNCNATGAL